MMQRKEIISFIYLSYHGNFNYWQKVLIRRIFHVKFILNCHLFMCMKIGRGQDVRGGPQLSSFSLMIIPIVRGGGGSTKCKT